MCGIAGLIQCGTENALKKMMRAINHRGPDDSGYEWFPKSGSGLGHVRLSIIDLSKAGHQPMYNDNHELCIIFNGEIYNYKEIRVELKNLGYQFHSNSDTEVLIKAYEQWNYHCLAKLNGMFAFAVWHSKTNTLFIARDRIGVKPLYYCQQGQSLIFSSEIKGIIQSGLYSQEINQMGLQLYLALAYVPSPMTLFKGISKLDPGHFMTYKNGQIQISRYWAAPYGMNHKKRDIDSYSSEFKHLFSDAVEKRMVSDVPIGAFLSGGIDSSVVVYEMSKLSKMPVRTYSVGFEEGGKHYDELEYAKIVSDLYQTDHEEIICDANEAKQLIPKLIYYLDEPVNDSLIYPTYKLSKIAKQTASVVLTGEGSDEFLHGYRFYSIINHYESLFSKIPPVLRKLLRTALSRYDVTENVKTRILSALICDSSFRRVLQWSSMFSEPDIKELMLYKSELSVEDYFSNEIPSSLNPKSIPSFFEHKYRLPDFILMSKDKMSMANALEMRNPFLDYRLVEFMVKLPINMKNPLGATKRLLRYSYREQLPREISQRPKKPFSSPIGFWLYDLYREYLLKSSLVNDGILRENIISKYATFSKKRANHSIKLWLLLMLEIWYRIYFDRTDSRLLHKISES